MLQRVCVVDPTIEKAEIENLPWPSVCKIFFCSTQDGVKPLNFAKCKSIACCLTPRGPCVPKTLSRHRPQAGQRAERKREREPETTETDDTEDISGGEEES